MIATGNQNYDNSNQTTGNNKVGLAATAIRGGYVDMGLNSGCSISVKADDSSYLSSRLGQVSDAYQETIRRTDAEFAGWSDASMGTDSAAAAVAEEVHSFRMSCECLDEECQMDLVEHVLTVRRDRVESSHPILIHVTNYQEAVELDRRLSAFGVATHLASPFSNWTSVLGKLGTGQIEVIISTTVDIPHVEQIAWNAIYLPSAVHLAMLTTPAMDWLGNYWFANNLDEQPPRLVIRRPSKVRATA